MTEESGDESSLKTISLYSDSTSLSQSNPSLRQQYKKSRNRSRKRSPKRSRKQSPKRSRKQSPKQTAIKENKQDSSTTKYIKPEKTFQDTLQSKEKILEYLTHYQECSIDSVPIGSHIRYITLDKSKEPKFRLGGYLKYVHAKYIYLTNNSVSWPVQRYFFTESQDVLYKTRFFKRMTKAQILQRKARKLTKENRRCKQKIKELKIKLQETLAT